mmetsp:Transcript_13709/g.37012  ORF Transcript_13709/g.37012 Transcript_13709/m.37012 type:complete len:220 (+) Transcript_13709:2747-3406(+)
MAPAAPRPLNCWTSVSVVSRMIEKYSCIPFMEKAGSKTRAAWSWTGSSSSVVKRPWPAMPLRSALYLKSRFWKTSGRLNISPNMSGSATTAVVLPSCCSGTPTSPDGILIVKKPPYSETSLGMCMCMPPSGCPGMSLPEPAGPVRSRRFPTMGKGAGPHGIGMPSASAGCLRFPAPLPPSARKMEVSIVGSIPLDGTSAASGRQCCFRVEMRQLEPEQA